MGVNRAMPRWPWQTGCVTHRRRGSAGWRVEGGGRWWKVGVWWKVVEGGGRCVTHRRRGSAALSRATSPLAGVAPTVADEGHEGRGHEE